VIYDTPGDPQESYEALMTVMKPSTNYACQPLALGLALLACLLAAALRLFPLEWNFAPVGALALFAGARLRPWLAFALPLAVLVTTDALLPQLRPSYAFPYPGMAFVYGSFAIYALLGRTLSRTESPLRIGATTGAGSVQFFIVTNFGVWLTSALYPPTLAGLVECYAAGVPFFHRTVGADLLFTAALFGAYAWLKGKVSAPAHGLQPVGVQGPAQGAELP
jgi:hypothetical protein